MIKKSIALIVALIILYGLSPVSAQPVLRIVYMSKENPPRILGDNPAIDWSKPGITLELLKMVEKKVGIPFQFKRMPWKRCLYMVETGLADATFHASYKPDRAQYGAYPLRGGELDPTRAIYKNAYAIYIKRGSGVTWNGEAFSNISRPIGTQLSYAVADDLRRMGYAVEEEGIAASNLDKLLTGRISAYAGMETIVDNILGKGNPRYQFVEKLQPVLGEKVRAYLHF